MKKMILSIIASLYATLTVQTTGYGNSDDCFFESEKLKNQMEILFISPKIKTDAATVILTVKTGSIFEEKYLGAGISHLLEHLLFKGTENRSDTELARKVKSIGGYINAQTSFDKTQYYINVPADKIEEALKILSEMIMQFNITDEEFEKEKSVILKEMNMNEDNPGRFLSDMFFRIHYYGTNLMFPIIGIRKKFKELTLNDVKDYYNDKYQPSNMILTICGNFDKNKIKKIIKKLFEKKENKHFIINDYSGIKRKIGIRKKVFYKENIYNTKVIIGFKSCDITSRYLYPLDLCSEILGGGISSRLQEKYGSKNIMRNIICYNYTPQFEGVFVIEYEIPAASKSTAQETIEMVMKEIEELQKQKITDEELEIAKRRVLLDHLLGYETVKSKAFNYTNNYIYSGGFGFPKEYINGINKTSKREISEAAKIFLNENNMTISILKPKTKRENNTDKAKTIKSIPKLTILKNGLKIIYRKDLSGISTIYVYVKGGSSFDFAGKEGISYITSKLLLKGTKNKKSNQIAKEIESLGAECETISGRNAIVLKIRVLNKNLENAIKLARELLMEPSFPKEEIEIQKQIALDSLKRINENLFSFAITELRKNIFKNHPYGRPVYGTQKSLKEIKRKDIIKFWQTVFTPDKTVFSITSNIEDKKIISFIKKNFENFKCKKTKESKQIHTAKFKNGKKQTTFPAKQSLILIAFNAPDIYQKTFREYEFLETFFSDQSSPIFEAIRTKKGLAYMTGAAYIAGPYGAFFVFYCATTPEKKEEALKTLVNEIQKFQKNGIKKKDFDWAYSSFTSDFLFSYETPSSKAQRNAFDELFGLGFKHLEEYEQNIKNIKLKEINKILSKSFDINKAFILTTTPN